AGLEREAYVFGRQTEQPGHRLRHVLAQRTELGCVECHDRSDVDQDRAGRPSPYTLQHSSDDHPTIQTGMRRIAGWEDLTDVAEGEARQQRVGNSVEQHVTIRVCLGSTRAARYGDAAYQQEIGRASCRER